jgi:enoyl-CoA hydratase/carnithine racemase
MASLVLVDDDGPIRTLTLNRPEKLNAMSLALTDELSVRLAEAATEESVRVVVITGSGRSFCAGYDLDEESPGEGYEVHLASLGRSLDHLLEVFDHPKPVIASVRGHCLAGGCDLMMMCDLTVAADNAVFGQPEIRFGSAIVAHVLPWLIGARSAKELILTGDDKVSADRAYQLGLVNRVVPVDQLENETMRLARDLAVIDPAVMEFTKKAINVGWEKAGFREALRTAVELGAVIESHHAPEREEFEKMVRTKGLRKAVEWRDRRFSE